MTDIAETITSRTTSGRMRPIRRSASIRTRIFLGCISLTFVTILVGILSERAQIALSKTTLGIYDDAFISMNDLRSAQSIVFGVSRDIALGDRDTAAFTAQLQSAMDALDVAEERAMSPRGKEWARKLQVSVAGLQADLLTMEDSIKRERFRSVERDFDMAVGIYAGDGFHLRRSGEALVWKTRVQTYLAILGSLAIAVVITLMLSHAIVPSIQHAVRVAAAIADGHLHNDMARKGPHDTSLLLGALGSMQSSIADKITCIETLMARQASSHAAEIALQHARLEAALNNMNLGLCMFDASNTLLIKNKRFQEMFQCNASNLSALLAQLDLVDEGRANESPPTSRSFNRVLPDGRTISVSEETINQDGRVVTYEDITERERVASRLSYMARHDALTGLPNRVLFREQIEERVKQMQAGGRLTVMCLDLDRFKTVNDTLGHSVGDALLCVAASRLSDTVGVEDMVVRLGGDEFAVVKYAETPAEETRDLTDALLEALGEPYDIDGHHIAISASIGIVATSDETETPDDLLKKADLALYSAKADGRGVYRFFENEMEAKIQARRQLEVDLRVALEEKQFEVFYQPLVSANGGVVVSFEALVRWHHPQRGMVSPAEFIPVAEEAGLIPELGLWVLNQACRDATGWPASVRLAVNLSPLQFRNRHLVLDVTAALSRSGLPSTRLDLEITESLLLQDNDSTLTMLHQLRALGVGISMDDFGTGYSSLSYLLRFPFDKIKIDRSFICDMAEGSDSISIVRAIISLAKSLHVKVVAEGVETNEQMALLREAGCQELQGYLFSRPRPVGAALALIENLSGGLPVFNENGVAQSDRLLANSSTKRRSRRAP